MQCCLFEPFSRAFNHFHQVARSLDRAGTGVKTAHNSKDGYREKVTDFNHFLWTPLGRTGAFLLQRWLTKQISNERHENYTVFNCHWTNTELEL